MSAGSDDLAVAALGTFSFVGDMLAPAEEAASVLLRSLASARAEVAEAVRTGAATVDVEADDDPSFTIARSFFDSALAASRSKVS